MPRRLTDRERQLRSVTERDLQSSVNGLLTTYGWRYFHAPDNRPVNGRIQNMKSGFPDILAVRCSRIIAAELKREGYDPRPDQLQWLDELSEAGAESYVWRPSDLPEIARILAPAWREPTSFRPAS